MTDPMNPEVTALLRAYARELNGVSPSKSLDARIEALVAAPVKNPARSAAPRVPVLRWAVAAGFAALAIAFGIIIGVRVERATAPLPAARTAVQEPTWPPADFTMWPTDSVALKIPAEVSPRGTLVAVNGKSKTTAARYWVDIVVSNDGTVRIENVVPAGEDHGVVLQEP
jgi:hypothetical protein